MRKMWVLTVTLLACCIGCSSVWRATTDAAAQWWNETGKDKVMDIAEDAALTAANRAEEAAKKYVAEKETQLAAKLTAKGVNLDNLGTAIGTAEEINELREKYEADKNAGLKPEDWMPTAGAAILYALYKGLTRGKAKVLAETVNKIAGTLKT